MADDEKPLYEDSKIKIKALENSKWQDTIFLMHGEKWIQYGFQVGYLKKCMQIPRERLEGVLSNMNSFIGRGLKEADLNY